MNKKLIHLITTKLPIVTLLILILSYAYLSIPNNYALQVGGMTVANTFPLPKNVPWKYKYRYLLLAIPIMLLIYFISTVLFYNKVTKMTTWDMGKEFFYEFQQQVKNAVQQGAVEDANAKSFNYKKIKIEDAPDANIKKLFNIITLAGDPSSQLSKESQYFCSTYRPCGCCEMDAYKKYFKTNKCK
jgi:hypothetical protein